MNRTLWLLLLAVAIVVVLIIVVAVHHAKGGGSGPSPPPHPTKPFSEVSGLQGGGYCYGPKNGYPATKIVAGAKTKDDCEQACKSDKDCAGYSAGPGVCVLYSKTDPPPTGYGKASSKWKSSYPFPTYASPYYSCEDPITKTGCMYHTPAQACQGPATGISCWRKNHIEDYQNFSVKVGKPDDLNAQVVVSNPYLPGYKLTTTKNTFYWWYLDLFKNAKEFVTIVNAYITLGKWQSEDPDDYQSAIYYGIKNALDRGVKVTWISLGTDQAACQSQVRSQFDSYAKTGKFVWIAFENYNNIGTWGTGGVFFHDKLYVSDQKAYIGGQNPSGSSSIDFGIGFDKTSPLYHDLVTRTAWFESRGTIAQNFKYTATKPYTASDGSKYFIALSPTWPTCPLTPKACAAGDPTAPYCNAWFPEFKCPIGPPTGPYRTDTYTAASPGGNPLGGSGTGLVSYERNHLINVVRNAKKFLNITSYSFSTMSSVLSKGGWDQDLENAFLTAAQNLVKINIWIHNNPIFGESMYSGNVTCDFMRCPEGKAFLDKMNSHSNVKFHWWYQNPPPVGDAWPECKTLHAKIHYSDWGLLVSSANLTPDYFGNMSNTALAVTFGNSIPEWISVGVENIFEILASRSKLKGGGTCDNPVGNFQQGPNDPRCNGTSCKGTCQACNGMWKGGSCGATCLSNLP